MIEQAEGVLFSLQNAELILVTVPYLRDWQVFRATASTLTLQRSGTQGLTRQVFCLLGERRLKPDV